MIGVELEAQRSYPANLARGLIADRNTPEGIAALRIVAEVLLMHANSLTDGKYGR